MAEQVVRPFGRKGLRLSAVNSSITSLCRSGQIQGHTFVSWGTGFLSDCGSASTWSGSHDMTAPTDYPFKTPRMAFRAIYIHLIAGIDKEFFKDMTTLKTSEFKNGHSLSPCNHQSSYVIKPRFEKLTKPGQDNPLTPWILKSWTPFSQLGEDL